MRVIRTSERKGGMKPISISFSTAQSLRSSQYHYASLSSLHLLVPSVIPCSYPLPFPLQANPTAIRLAQVKLPVPSEFISHAAPPRLGSITTSALAPPPEATPVPALLAAQDAKGEGKARGIVLAREERRVSEVEAAVLAMERLSVGEVGARV